MKRSTKKEKEGNLRRERGREEDKVRESKEETLRAAMPDNYK